MNLAEAPATAPSAKVVASSTPTDRVTLEVSGTNITLPASDVARLVIEHLLRATQPSAATLPTVEIGEMQCFTKSEADEVKQALTRFTDKFIVPYEKAATRADAPPRIGALWSAEGGVYAGIVRGADGHPDHHLVVAEAAPAGALPWKDAMEWAQGLLRDFTLPDRREQAVLYGNVPELFEKEWYWSRESNAGSPEYAWCQRFGYGSQSNDRKDYELRARAVRRVPIQ